MASDKALRLSCRFIVVGADKIDLADDVACQIKMERAVVLHWKLPP
jgi:hypothetical protein